MILFLFILLFIPIIILGYKKDKSLGSPIVVFPVIWTWIATMTYLRLMPINEVSNRTFFIVILGVLSFCIGALFYRKPSVKLHQIQSNNIDVDKFRKYFIALEVLAILIMTLSSLVVITLLRSGYSMEDIYFMRLQMAKGGDNALSGVSDINVILLEFIARPILAIAVPFTVLDYLLNNKKTTLLYTIILLVLGYINKANRLDILMSIFILAYSYVLLEKKRRINGLLLARFGLVFIAIFVLFNYLTNMRGGKADFISTLYYYSCGNLPFFDIRLHELDLSHTYTIFLSSFQGVVRPFGQALSMIGIEIPQLYLIASEYVNVEDVVDIGSEGTFNAFIGPFYFFYCDLGYIGIIFYSLILGWVMEKLYYKTILLHTLLPALFFVMFFVRGCVFSFYNFLLSGITYGMAFWILIALYFKTKK